MCQTTDVFIEVEFEEGERELRRYKVPNRADGKVLGSIFHPPIAKLLLPTNNDVAYVYCMNGDTYLVINKDGDKVCAVPRSFFYALRCLPGPDERNQNKRMAVVPERK